MAWGYVEIFSAPKCEFGAILELDLCPSFQHPTDMSLFAPIGGDVRPLVGGPMKAAGEDDLLFA